VKSLQGWGYRSAYSLKGGMNAAREAGLEIEVPTGDPKGVPGEQHLR
jgi:hypothetical protein